MDGFSDDQIALIGCFVALLFSGTLMSLSFYLGKGARDRTAAKDADVISLRKGVPAVQRVHQTTAPANHKRAA